MPYKNPKDKARKERSRKTLIRQLIVNYLGKACVDCGKGPPFVKLEFDHIMPEEKDFPIGRNINKPWPDLKKEIDKCHLLCRPCHLDKTYGLLPF